MITFQKHGLQRNKLLLKIGKKISLSYFFLIYNLLNSFTNREQGLQTKKDNYSNVPQPKVYLAGLRGVERNIDGSFKQTNMQKIDLTLDVDQK